jgi:hypothetical protein
LTQQEFPYLQLQKGPEIGLVVLLDIIIDLYGKNIYLPLDKKFPHRPRKTTPFFCLSDMHRKILDVLSHYTFQMKDAKSVIDKCRLITNKDIFFKKLKLANISQEDQEYLFRPYTTFLTQGAYFNDGILHDRRMAHDQTPKRLNNTGCLRFN